MILANVYSSHNTASLPVVFSVYLQLVAVSEASRNVLLPLIFDYGKCHSVDKLKELLLHLETVPLNTERHYLL